MQADPHDEDFMDGMKNLLGLDADAVNKLLAKLSANTLMNLTDAVAKGDKRTARSAVRGAEEEDGVASLNPLLRGDDGRRLDDKDTTDEEDDPDEARDLDLHDDKPDRDKKDAGGDDDDAELAMGDAVSVRVGEEDQDATVKVPRAPGDTVGVLIKGKLKMVDRSDVTRMDEMMLGMNALPSLARIQQLAGIDTGEATDGLPAPGEASPLSLGYDGVDAEADLDREEDIDSEVDFDGKVGGDPAETAMSALDTLEAALPAITLGDLKAVRQRIYALTQTMNESLSFTGKAVMETKREKRTSFAPTPGRKLKK